MQPDFFSKTFLEQHIRDTLIFYDPSVLDPNGGFFHHFRNDGSLYSPSIRHLVSSTRFIFNYAMADSYFSDLDYKDWIKHGLQYLQRSHLQADSGYAWVLNEDKVVDDSNHCYGLAFVLIAGATALLAGVKDGKTVLENAWRLMENHFWDTNSELYADQANSDFSTIDPYRGQNANMHACEAMLWAYEATQEAHYLQRACVLASNITRRQAAKAEGRIWEHYDSDWNIDWQYNKKDPKHLFRPWGFQPGHFTEWSKLLLILHRFQPADWYLPKAEELFQMALESAWDDEFGGIYYGVAPDGSICDTDKYFWVQAESFAAAALLAQATGQRIYHDWYQRIWAYCWEHMVDHNHGAWYRILTRDNRQYDDKKSPAGKTDYHTMGACYEVLRSQIIMV